MRKLHYYMTAALLLFAAGCQHEEIASVEQDDGVLEVYASIEDVDGAETRTYLSGNEVYWSSGDKIAVFYKNTLRKRFDVTPESIDSKNATFLLDEGYVQMGSNVNVSHNVAYYPFCEVTCAPDGSSYTLSNLTLPSTQSYVDGSVGLGAFPMVAVTENTDDVNFCFKNICGVMQFQLKGSGFVKSVSVRGNRGEVLAGSAVVTAGYGKEPSISMSAEGVKEVTLDCGESGVELNETTPVSFFIVLPPVGFEGGFTITVTDIWGGSKEYSTAKKNPIVRSKGLRMPSKEYIGVRPPQEGDYIDEYGVNHGPGIEIDGVVWAPVNCGYHKDDFKYGKLYQWGRKYGVGYYGDLWDNDVKTEEVYEDGILPEMVEGLVYLKEYQSSEYDDVFFAVPPILVPKDFPHWRPTLWNHGSDESPVRSEYDPCPTGWRVPTYNELKSIILNRTWGMHDKQYGCWFTDSDNPSSLAPRIFLPVAGGMIDGGNSASGRGNTGCYWSSLSSESGLNNMLCFDSIDYFLDIWYSNEAPAASIRCVKDDSELIQVESITINKTSLTLSMGSTETLSASFLPANANQKEIYWYSKDNWVATVDASGKIEAKGPGTVTITAMAGMQTAECVVTVVAVQEGDYIDEYGVNHGQGIEIDGVVWAPVNCGYKAPTADSKGFSYGKLYQWGRKYGQGYEGTFYINGTQSGRYSDESSPVIEKGGISPISGNDIGYSNVFFTGTYEYTEHWSYPADGTLWTEKTRGKYDPCPDGWRVPNVDELDGLIKNKSSWTTYQNQEGYWFSGNSAYSNDVSQVFLPAAGSLAYTSGAAYGRGNAGYYWSSSTYSGSSFLLIFSNGSSRTDGYGGARASGHAVRCVQL